MNKVTYKCNYFDQIVNVVQLHDTMGMETEQSGQNIYLNKGNNILSEFKSYFLAVHTNRNVIKQTAMITLAQPGVKKNT